VCTNRDSSPRTGPRSGADQTQAGAAAALRRVAEDESIQRVTVAQLLETVHESKSAVLVPLFAAPNALPMRAA